MHVTWPGSSHDAEAGFRIFHLLSIARRVAVLFCVCLALQMSIASATIAETVVLFCHSSRPLIW